MRYVIEIFLPVVDGAHFAAVVGSLRSELAKRFGGVTLFSRAPAEGEWRDDANQSERDDIIIVEVMTEALDQAFWAALRRRLESELGQQEILIRASSCVQL
jgi:hypothetical protein